MLGSERTQRIAAGSIIVLVVLAAGVFGIAESNDGPQSVFWAAVRNSMSTTSVTIGTTSTELGETAKILGQLDFGQHPASRVLTTLITKGATAQTETLTTPSGEYTRYDYIHKTTKGKPVNFTSVLGLWAKTASYSGNIVPPSFSEILLDQPLPMPIGNLTTVERNQLIAQMQQQQVYTISSTKKTIYQGRTAYVYKVSIQPVIYLQLLKSYAPDLAMHQFDQINPNSYDGEPNVVATWTIDTKSKDLVNANYGSGRVQTYSGWGVPITIQTPTHTVTATDLQQRLNKIL